MKGFTRERALKEEDIERLEEIADENEHIIDLWEPLEFNIDSSYEYVPKDTIFNMFSDVLYYLIAYPILKVLTKIVYDLKIEGREKYRFFRKREQLVFQIMFYFFGLCYGRIGMGAKKSILYNFRRKL